METSNATGVSFGTIGLCCLLLLAVGASVFAPGTGIWVIGAAGALFAFRRGKRRAWGEADYALIAASVFLILISIVFRFPL